MKLYLYFKLLINIYCVFNKNIFLYIILYLMYTRCNINAYRSRIISNYLDLRNVKRPLSRIQLTFLSNIRNYFGENNQNKTIVTISDCEGSKSTKIWGDLIQAAKTTESDLFSEPSESEYLDGSVESSFSKCYEPGPNMNDSNYAIATVPKDGDKLYLTVVWNNHKLNMERRKKETIEVTLKRLKKSLGKAEVGKDAKGKKNQVEEEPEFSVSFLTNLFKTFDENSVCEDTIMKSSFISINETLLKLFTNVPQLDRVKVFPSAMVDCPVPLVVRDDSDEIYTKVSVEWMDSDGNILSNNLVYIPILSDLGKTIKARVTNDLLKYDVLESNPTRVDLAPYCPWQLDRINKFNSSQKAHVSSPLQDNNQDLRVMSFNILSPTYISPSDPANFFRYCPEEYLELNYRNQLIGREILYLNPQILCLQECSYRVYKDYLDYLFGQNYHSWLTIKGGNSPEGCAMFVSKSRFEQLETSGVHFKDLVRTERYRPLVERLCKTWLCYDDNYFHKYHTIYQFGCYRNKKTGKYMFLANTHLYFHPMANHIRLLQTYLLLSELESFKLALSNNHGFDIMKDSYTLICGDFNSIPEESIHHLISKGYIRYDHPDWKLGDTFVYDKNILQQEGYDRLKQAMNNQEDHMNRDAYLVVDNYQGYTDSYGQNQLSFTNYCESFNGTLDYIYHSNNVKAKRVMPGITSEEASEYIGLPSKLYPSDHLSIAADF